MQPFEVPGHDVLELLGYGPLGEVWRARRGVQPVVLRRLVEVDPGALAEVRRQATVVRTLTSPHLVRLKTVLRVQDDDVLVLDHAGGGSLAALLAGRGTLSPGEAVTVLAPVAEALGAAHAHGLQHGRLTARRVLLAADGRPLLDGLGLAPLHPAAARAGPAEDVAALGALGLQLLTGAAPGAAPELPATTPVPLAQVLLAALDPDPAARPGAAELAAGLLAACPAAPLPGLSGPVAGPAPGRPGAGASGWAAPLAAAAALLLVVLLGWSWGARGVPGSAADSSTLTPVPTDWAAVVAGLDQLRSRAFTTGSPRPLDRVYPRASRLRAADEAALADLRSRHVTARGLRHWVLTARPRAPAARTVELVVTEQLAPYALVDRRGVVVERHTAGPVQQVRLLLARADGDGWRVADVGPDR